MFLIANSRIILIFRTVSTSRRAETMVDGLPRAYRFESDIVCACGAGFVFGASPKRAARKRCKREPAWLRVAAHGGQRGHVFGSRFRQSWSSWRAGPLAFEQKTAAHLP